jgi:hypothetical protein
MVVDKMDETCNMHERRKNAYKIVAGKPDANRQLGRPRHKWEDNIKMDL